MITILKKYSCDRARAKLSEEKYYPLAVLFGFGATWVAFDLYAGVTAALRAAHPASVIDHTASEYFLAAEIATTMISVNIAVPARDWPSIEYELRPFPCERE